jgi:lipoate-protein ligase A
LLFFCRQFGGGAIVIDNGGIAVITGSEFVGNTASDGGNNIYEFAGDVTCDDGNTFESSGGGSNNNLDGNFPKKLCK